MTGPRMNHVEARSSREPARQYVSETHDHKPDAPTRAEPRSEQAREHEPIFHLISGLLLSGNDLVRSGGYMAALQHTDRLNDHLMRLQVIEARKAIKKASDALDAYEAAIAKAEADHD